MARMRMLQEAFAYLVEKDPETAITRHALRRMMLSGTIPCVSVGRRRLVNLDILDDFLEHPERFIPPQESGKIRRIG